MVGDNRSNQNAGKKRNNQDRIECSFCNKWGHIRSACWHLPENRKKKSVGFDGKMGNNRTRSDGRNDGYCIISNEERTAVIVEARIHGKSSLVLIDTGAGPCVIDIEILKQWNLIRLIKWNTKGEKLQGLGSAKSLGTIVLNFCLHPKLQRNQTFKVVQNLNGTILIGRSFLAQFETLEINWKKITLKIDDIFVKGKGLVHGGELESRVCVANKKDTEDDIEEQLRKHVESNKDIDDKQKGELLELLLEYSDLVIENPKKPPERGTFSITCDQYRNCQPVRIRIRRLPLKWIDEIESPIK